MTERFRHLEIEITSTCDMGCPNCDRFVDVCPTTPMTVDQIRHFVQESLDLCWTWDRIHILGGEPTLHKQFRAVVEELIAYRVYYPQTRLVVISNGSGKLNEHRQWIAWKGVDFTIESKRPKVDPPYFQNMRKAPCDSGHTDLAPCALFGIAGCGVGLTKFGYFLCGAGGAIARVTGRDIGVQKLADVTYERMLEQAKILCQLCGHHESTAIKWTEDGATSPFWANALAQYATKTPPMTLYGAK